MGNGCWGMMRDWGLNTNFHELERIFDALVGVVSNKQDEAMRMQKAVGQAVQNDTNHRHCVLLETTPTKA